MASAGAEPHVADLDFAFAALRARLQQEWRHELTYVVRGAPIAGFVPNIRVTIASADGTPALPALVDDYLSRIAESFPAPQIRRRQPRPGSTAVELELALDLGAGGVTVHRAVLAVYDNLVFTVATNAPATAAAELSATLERVITSLVVP